MKIYFDKGWYNLEELEGKPYIWSGPESHLIVKESHDADTIIILKILNHSNKKTNFSISTIEHGSLETKVFLSSVLKPKEETLIKIPAFNLNKIILKSDYFIPNNTDTRKLGLMLCDMFIFNNGKCSRIFLSNTLNHNSLFLANTSLYINKNSLCNTKNYLECICLLVTGNELSSGLYTHLENQIRKTIGSNNHICNNIDFKIIIKDTDQQYYNIDFLKQFKSVEFIKLHIPEEYDFYRQNNMIVLDKDKHKYGTCSGPNYVFFNSLSYLTSYNTTLYLECDCFLNYQWIEHLFNYVNSSGGFWISGAIYDGKNNFASNNLVNSHLNGGICLYKTSDNCFQSFMKLCLDMLPTYIISYNEKIPYDMYIKYLIDYHFDNDLTNRDIWQFIRRQYVHNNLILNYSTKNDKNIDVDSIFNLYQCSIIHKKPN